jgi:uncharacterized membrane protein
MGLRLSVNLPEGRFDSKDIVTVLNSLDKSSAVMYPIYIGGLFVAYTMAMGVYNAYMAHGPKAHMMTHAWDKGSSAQDLASSPRA